LQPVSLQTLAYFFGGGAAGEERADEVFDVGEDLVEGEAGGIDDDGVGRGTKRGVGTIAIALVALADLLKDDRMVGVGRGQGAIPGAGILLVGAGVLFVTGVVGGRLRAGVLLVAALAARFRGGIEKNFDIGVGEDDGADVAAFHNYTAAAAEVALEIDHPGANVGVDADARGSLGDVGVADALGDVGAVEKDAAAGAVGLEGDVGVAGETLKGAGVVEVLIGHDGFEGEGAVHSAGFEVEKTEVLREMTGDGALAGAGGAVDGDDGAAVHSGFSS
jgi:hypothetical protein